MSKKKDPAIQPGDGARAFDTIRDDFITDKWGYAIELVKKRQLEQENWIDYHDEFSTLIACFAGCAPDMPLKIAYTLSRKLINERRNWENE